MKLEMIEDLNEKENDTVEKVDEFTRNLNDRIQIYYLKHQMSPKTDVAQIPDADYNDILKRSIFVTFRKDYFFCVVMAVLAESFGVF